MVIEISDGLNKKDNPSVRNVALIQKKQNSLNYIICKFFVTKEKITILCTKYVFGPDVFALVCVGKQNCEVMHIREKIFQGM